MPIPVKHFYMIRHGETEANVNRIMAGSMETPLTENGRKQAQSAALVAERLEIRPTIILHSHLSRARDTASIINEKLGLEMREDADLGEINSGDYEGVPYDDCGEFLAHKEDPPGGERFVEFFERIKRAKNKALSLEGHIPLIVSHGGYFRGFGSIYGEFCKIVPNCTLHEFTPHDHDHPFPWDVWVHQEDGRQKADFFVPGHERPVGVQVASYTPPSPKE